MGLIRRLPTQVVNQIAAGEVVERPASIVKELMENALDASSKRIDVFITDGGLTKIEIRDDGSGIFKEDLPLAIERFSTSKLESAEDLLSIGTYGFRGEALASIGSVSKLKVTSKTANSDIGYTIAVNYGDISNIEPASRSQGTTIEVSDIFSLIPARLKFLKSKDTEFKYVLEVFQNIALVRPDIHFTLTHNGKNIYDLPVLSESDKTPLHASRLTDILKVEKSQLIPVSFNEYGMEVVGFVLHPQFLAETSRFMRTFVNLRPVEDKGIVRSTQKGLEAYIPHNYRVSGVLSVHIPQSQLDVNVHPRKTEVKFLNPFRVYNLVTQSVENAVKGTVSQEMNIPMQQGSSYSNNGMAAASSKWEARSQNAYNRLRGDQNSFWQGNNDTSDAQQQLETNYFGEQPTMYSSQTESAGDADQKSIVRQRDNHTILSVMPVLGRYLIVEWDNCIWIADQHAAAERIRFEAFKNAYIGTKPLAGQHVLTPYKIPLAENELIIAKNNAETFNKLGFSISFDGNTLLVNTIPAFLQKADIEKVVRESLSELNEIDSLGLIPDVSDFSSTKDISLVIATMACHNSIRMNERLSKEEGKSLITDLLKCQVPYACPHGRRIIWILETEVIDKQFMRP